MFFVITFYGPTVFLGPYYQYQYPLPKDVWYYVNRLDTLLLLATVVTGALFVANFGKKELIYRLTVYLFIISMGLSFLSLLRTLFT